MRINPYFEVNGNRFEIKQTRWLIAEYHKLQDQNETSNADKASAMKAQNLANEVRKFAEKERDCWLKLCDEPTEENQRIYLMFKGMSDKAIEEYNNFVSNNDIITTARDQGVDILEKVVVKGLAEQYFGFNENLAKQTWEMFCETLSSQDLVDEWLVGMAQCLFGEEDEVEDNSFLAQMRKKNEERENNRKNGLRKKR